MLVVRSLNQWEQRILSWWCDYDVSTNPKRKRKHHDKGKSRRFAELAQSKF
jgi:hypothetical protein